MEKRGYFVRQSTFTLFSACQDPGGSELALVLVRGRTFVRDHVSVFRHSWGCRLVPMALRYTSTYQLPPSMPFDGKFTQYFFLLVRSPLSVTTPTHGPVSRDSSVMGPLFRTVPGYSTPSKVTWMSRVLVGPVLGRGSGSERV